MWAAVALLGAAAALRAADRPPLAFGVLNQRSIALTAEYWNPILDYVSKKSGVPLRLKLGRTAAETTAMTIRGEFSFVYTNHLFTPERATLGYRVVARPDTQGIQGIVIVPDGSEVRRLADLEGKSVAFASKEAFVGYWLPMDALLRAGITIRPVFAGNQEGALAQLTAGTVAAAAVNASIARDYARREKLVTRVVWTSESYPDLCVMAAPSVSQGDAVAVQGALTGMAAGEEGRRVLGVSASALSLAGPVGFVPASDREYEIYRRFYRTTAVKD